MFLEVREALLAVSWAFMLLTGFAGYLLKRSINKMDKDINDISERVEHVERTQLTEETFNSFKSDLRQDIRDMKEDTEKKWTLLLGQVSEVRAETNQVKTHLMGKK